jgi:hypothetical protein
MRRVNLLPRPAAASKGGGKAGVNPSHALAHSRGQGLGQEGGVGGNGPFQIEVERQGLGKVIGGTRGWKQSKLRLNDKACVTARGQANRRCKREEGGDVQVSKKTPALEIAVFFTHSGPWTSLPLETQLQGAARSPRSSMCVSRESKSKF